MDREDIVKEINRLIHLDIDAVNAYREAIERIEILDIQGNLEDFMADHENHIQELSSALIRMGEEPPERKKDFKGYLIEGMTTVRSVTGTLGALKAMKTNEELTNRTYEKALSRELPSDLRMLVRKNREDERRHLNYIIMAIDRVERQAEQKEVA